MNTYMLEMIEYCIVILVFIEIELSILKHYCINVKLGTSSKCKE